MRALALLFVTLSAASAADPADRYGGSLLPGAGPVVDRLGVAPTADPFRWQVDATEVPAGGEGVVALRLVVPAGTHVYRDGIEVNVLDGGGLVVGTPDLPPGRRVVDPGDPTAGERELYDLDVIVNVPVAAPAGVTGLRTVSLDLRHQGCKPGLCFPPVQTPVGALVRVAAP